MIIRLFGDQVSEPGRCRVCLSRLRPVSQERLCEIADEEGLGRDDVDQLWYVGWCPICKDEVDESGLVDEPTEFTGRLPGFASDGMFSDFAGLED